MDIWFHKIILFLIILLCIEKSSSQFADVYCYECNNCTDPFNANQSTKSTTTCNACYKLSVTIAYAPTSYVIRRCLPACLETYQTFGGGSIISTCCATNLCNTSSIITFSRNSCFFIFIFIILNFLKEFF